MTKLKLGGEYQTRDGHPARVLCVDALDDVSRAIALVRLDNCEYPYRYKLNGKCLSEGFAGDLDLVEKPKKHKHIYYTAHFLGKQGQSTMTTYWSRESAVYCNSGNQYLIAITGPHEIEFTEGEGLSER